MTNEEARLRESTRQIIFDNIVCQDTDECFDSSSQSCKSCNLNSNAVPKSFGPKGKKASETAFAPLDWKA